MLVYHHIFRLQITVNNIESTEGIHSSHHIIDIINTSRFKQGGAIDDVRERNRQKLHRNKEIVGFRMGTKLLPMLVQLDYIPGLNSFQNKCFHAIPLMGFLDSYNFLHTHNPPQVGGTHTSTA